MMFRGKVRQVHFVGIGGSGMNGLAEVLLTLGFVVSGSDMKESGTVARLRSLGAQVFIGHRAENIVGADVIVRSTAVPDHNPELSAGRAQAIPVIPRAELLAELMRMKYGVAVAGTHGKTTTTSMIAQILGAAGLDPTVVIGGKLDALGSNAKLGQGELLVAEADESDGSFLLLAPTVAVITNIDPEHLDHYGDFATLRRAFVDFANKVPFFGFTVACLDHPIVQESLPELRRRVVTYGLTRQADLRGDDIRCDGLETSFAVHRGAETLGRLRLMMPGQHNVQNALAAAATALGLDIPFEQVAAGLDGFTGVQRRFTVVGEAGGVMVVDDYGHHPEEIRATLAAARAGFEKRRIIAVFQPHRYTRVRDLHADFCRAFNRADRVLVCPIAAAGEAPIDGIDHQSLAEGLRRYGHRGVERVDDLDEALTRLTDMAQPGDLVITLGAGNVNSICAPLVQRLGGEPR
jgi:UDP-N-acetylmuramate--alanine ligase